MRAPLRAARCLRRTYPNFVALQCARRCGLRIAFVASECLRISLRCGACAAVGRALRLSQPNAEEFRGSAVRTPLWVAYCVCRIRMLKNIVSLKHFVASHAYAVVGCALRLSHPNAEGCRCFAARKHTYIVPELVGHSFIFNRDSLI